jgi:hypothetical protein
MIRLDKSLLAAYQRTVDTAETERRECIECRSEVGANQLLYFTWWPIFFYRIATDNFPAARDVAHRLVEDAKYALFGDWRIGYTGWDEKAGKDVVWDHELARKYFNWFGAFRMGLAAAAFLNDWRAAAEIASYTEGSPLPTWSAQIDAVYTPDSASFYIELSRLIRGKRAGVHATTPFTAKIPIPRAKLLRRCVVALDQRDAAGSTQALAEFMKYYDARERDKLAPVELISVDGTILYHFIRHHLNVEAPLDAKYLAMIAQVP